MKRNIPYENELFTASRMLNAFIVKLEGHTVTIVLGLRDDIYQYEEEGVITYCISAIEPLVHIFPRIYKVEVSPGDVRTKVYISSIGGLSNQQIDELAKSFGAALMEPIEEEVVNGEHRTTVELITEQMGEFFKFRKG